MFDSPISQQIIATLAGGSRNSAALVALVAKAQNCSVQSVYAVLRKLRERSVVLSHKRTLTLNVVWIEEQSELLRRAQATYLENSDSGSFSIGTLEEGDRVTYQFKNPVLLDEMWGHAFILLLERTPRDVPIMIYNPHSWFPIVRYQSEKTIFQSLFNAGFKAFFSLAGKEDLDRDVCKTFIEPIGHSYSMGVTVGQKQNKYLNVVGDYVIEVELDQAVSSKIDEYFRRHQTLAQADKAELQQIVTTPGRNKLTISRNSKKAGRWRAKLAKDFLIPTASRHLV